MKIIKGTSRQQIQFNSLDDQVAVDNPVRIIDAFADRLDMESRGIKKLPALLRKSKPGGAPR